MNYSFSTTALLCAALIPALLSSNKSSAEGSLVALTNIVAGVVLKSEPVTITLTPRPEFRSTLDAARSGTGVVTLAVEGIEGTSTQPIRMNVFLDKPEATRWTPIDDPHFLGYVYLIPLRGQVRRTGRAFELSNAKVFDTTTGLRVTLVLVTGANMPPANTSLIIGEIYVREEN